MGAALTFGFIIISVTMFMAARQGADLNIVLAPLWLTIYLCLTLALRRLGLYLRAATLAVLALALLTYLAALLAGMACLFLAELLRIPAVLEFFRHFVQERGAAGSVRLFIGIATSVPILLLVLLVLALTAISKVLARNRKATAELAPDDPLML